MKKFENRSSKFLIETSRIAVALVVFIAAAIPANASAVRASLVNLTVNGLMIGGFYEQTTPIPAVLPFLTNLNDITPDGEMAVFTTTVGADNFVLGVLDNSSINANPDVIVRNLRTGEMFCASCTIYQGTYAAFHGSNARISANGRYVVYTGLLPFGSVAIEQVLRFDVQTGNLETVSVGTLPDTYGNATSASPVVSDDGRYVAFLSDASNLIAGYPASGSGTQLFVRDMQNAQTFLASHASGSTTQPGNAQIDTNQPISMSSDGRFVVFTSAAGNYIPSFDFNGVNDVYYFDTQIPNISVKSVSFNITGTGTGNGASFGGIVSADSTPAAPSILFASNATNINPADTNPGTDIYCFKGTLIPRLVSIARDGTAANAPSSSYATISRNGRFVSFASKASNLVNGVDEATNTTNDVFLRDLQNDTTRYVSLNNTTNAPSTTADGTFIPFPNVGFVRSNLFLNRNLSNDGRYVAFSATEPFSARDTGNGADVYVRDMNSGVSILASLNKSGSGGQNASDIFSDFALSADGRKVFYTTKANNLFSGDTTSISNSKVFRANISLLSERSVSDFNGDGKNDYSVFRPSENNWYALLDPTSGNYSQVLFGEAGNRLAPGDYDGDSRTDYAVFSPAQGRWEIFQSSDGSLVTKLFGTASDILTPADFDGDGKTDQAYFRPSTATWFILQSNTNSLRSVKFGLNGDLPSVGDFDGDNRADIALFRPATGDWWILRSTDNAFYSFHWGISTDKPVTGDYDGDGKSDAAVYRDGTWFILNSRDNTYQIFQWGLSTDRPVVSDYDGDGKTDAAVFRPSESIWYIRRSSDNSLSTIQWGVSGDIPVPAAYIP